MNTDTKQSSIIIFAQFKSGCCAWAATAWALAGPLNGVTLSSSWSIFLVPALRKFISLSRWKKKRRGMGLWDHLVYRRELFEIYKWERSEFIPKDLKAIKGEEHYNTFTAKGEEHHNTFVSHAQLNNRKPFFNSIKFSSIHPTKSRLCSVALIRPTTLCASSSRITTRKPRSRDKIILPLLP